MKFLYPPPPPDQVDFIFCFGTFTIECSIKRKLVYIIDIE